MSSDAPTPPDDDFPAGQTGDMRDVLLSPPTGPKTPAGPWQPPTAEELQKLLPQYEITALLGRGGMGAVYKGRQIALDRPVAIKILSNTLEEADASFAERFKNEARALGKLSHPGIVGVYDFGEAANGLLYIVMEFIDGTDVAKMLSQQKRLHTEHAMAITAHVCDALAYAHERGIIHRDIKPANIMVGYDGVVKVADFGLAKMTHSQNSGLTQSGMAMGTLHYMAPEALMLGAGVDHRADIYAVGVMLYQMLTGKIPQGLFELPSLQVPGLDPRYDGIIGKALREDRELRYPSVLNMRHDLDAILTQPVVKVEATAEKAPAALQTQARPQRPGGQPYRPPQPEVIVRTEKKSSPMLWVGFVAMACLAGWLVLNKGEESKPSDAQQSSTVEKESDSPEAFSNGNRPSLSRNIVKMNVVKVTKDQPGINSLGMKFVPVPGTGVLMCIHETRRQDYAAYANEVAGVNGKWKSMMRENVVVGGENDHPVVGVSYSDAVSFCEWLSAMEGLKYRLPSETEWNAAVFDGSPPSDLKYSQGGATPSKASYPWGERFPPDSSQRVGNYADVAWHQQFSTDNWIDGFSDGYATTAPVMSYKENSLGIFDLGGNVIEWCQDWFNENALERVVRGGCFLTGDADRCQSGYRVRMHPVSRYDFQGFRCVVERGLPKVVNEKTTTDLQAASADMTRREFNSQVTDVSTPQPPAPTLPTTWTDTKGRSITATFKAIASGNVLLDIAGKVTPVPLNTLSAESQKLARNLAQQAPPSASNAASLPAMADPAVAKQTAAARPYPLDGMPESAKDHVRRGVSIVKVVASNIKPYLRLTPTQEEWIKQRDVKLQTDCGLVRIREAANGGGSNEVIQLHGEALRDVLDQFSMEQLLTWEAILGPGAEQMRVYTGGPYLAAIKKKRLAGFGPGAGEPAAIVFAPASASLASATKDKPFVNSLGMKFVPVPGTRVLFSIWETRVQDYSVFARSSKVDDAWTNRQRNGIPVAHDRDHPVVAVNWEEAQAFCRWLTDKETTAGKLTKGWLYRLPKDAEWSTAAGLTSEEGTSPSQKGARSQEHYPWGNTFPPPTTKIGNYADSSWHDAFPNDMWMNGYTDGFPTTAPVGSFPANLHGIHDLGGNVWEWCGDLLTPQGTKRVLRGGSWGNMLRDDLRSTCRYFFAEPESRPHSYGFRCVLELP